MSTINLENELISLDAAEAAVATADTTKCSGCGATINIAISVELVDGSHICDDCFFAA